MISNSIKNYWEKLEKKKKPPKYVRKINVIEFDELKKKFSSKNQSAIKKIVKKMYDGDAYILRNAAKKNLKKTVLDLAKYYDKKQKPSFHKMYDGVPNFHRIIDKKIAKKYSIYAIKHSYYFFNWNIRNKLEKKLKDQVYRHWRYIKLLAGNRKFQFENNIPSQNQIERIQIVNYPLGGGELRDHVDPRKNQRVVSGLIMSKTGEDFKDGGFYFKKNKNKKMNIEKSLTVGDSVMFYGSIVHGVDVVNNKDKLDWKSYRGRWFIGMFVNDSDHVKDRITASDLTKSVKS